MNGGLRANYRDTLRQTSSKSGRERAALLFRLATTQRAGTRLFWRRRHLFSLTPASKSGDAEPKRFCFREVELRLCLAARASQQTAGARSCGCVQHADNQFNISYPAGPAAGETHARFTTQCARSRRVTRCTQVSVNCSCIMLALAPVSTARPGSTLVLHGIIPFASSSPSIRPPAADWLAIIAFSGQSCLGALQRSCFCAAT